MTNLWTPKKVEARLIEWVQTFPKLSDLERERLYSSQTFWHEWRSSGEKDDLMTAMRGYVVRHNRMAYPYVQATASDIERFHEASTWLCWIDHIYDRKMAIGVAVWKLSGRKMNWAFIKKLGWGALATRTLQRRYNSALVKIADRLNA